MQSWFCNKIWFSLSQITDIKKCELVKGHPMLCIGILSFARFPSCAPPFQGIYNTDLLDLSSKSHPGDGQ